MGPRKGADPRLVAVLAAASGGPEIGADDCVVAVSHRGTKRYPALALGRAREAGCRTALVTGEGEAGGDAAGIVFRIRPRACPRRPCSTAPSSASRPRTSSS